MSLTKIALFSVMYGGSLRSLHRVVKSHHKPVGGRARKAQFAAVVSARRQAAANVRAVSRLLWVPPKTALPWNLHLDRRLSGA